MKAMAINQFGSADQLQQVDVPEPKPGDNDLMVEVRAAAVNPVDTKIRAGGLGSQPPFPLVLGYDVSGVVVAVGNHVRGFKAGDEVYGSPKLVGQGSNAQLVLLDHRAAAYKPQSISHEQAAAMPLVTITAWEALYDRAQLNSGSTVLIQGGAGGVGHIALQLARARNCTIITTASRDESIALCKSLGATTVIDYKNEDFVQRVNDETGGQGCDVVFDTVGGDVFGRSLDCVAVDGQIAAILPNDTSSVGEKLFMKSATLHLEFMGAPGVHGKNPQRQGRILREAAVLVDEGRLMPHIQQTMPMTDVAKAHELQEARHVTGKLVLTNNWN